MALVVQRTARTRIGAREFRFRADLETGPRVPEDAGRHRKEK
jgi:hypothetical protein